MCAIYKLKLEEEGSGDMLPLGLRWGVSLIKANKIESLGGGGAIYSPALTDSN